MRIIIIISILAVILISYELYASGKLPSLKRTKTADDLINEPSDDYVDDKNDDEPTKREKRKLYIQAQIDARKRKNKRGQCRTACNFSYPFNYRKRKECRGKCSLIM